MLSLEIRGSKPLYLQIVQAIREQIQAGILSQGDKLPSVRELAGEMTINPNTIQRAYRELENQGLIVTLPGKGSFISGAKAEDAALWQAFDQAAQKLMDQGISRESLLAHLIQGGSSHAED